MEEISSEFVEEQFNIFHFYDNADLQKSIHVHEFYELQFFLSGDVSVQVEECIFRLSAGDVVLLGPQKLHRFLTEDGVHPYEHIVVWLEPSLLTALSTPEWDLSRCFRMPGRSVLHFSLQELQPLERLLETLQACGTYRGFGRGLLQASCLTELLIRVNESAGAGHDVQSQNRWAYPLVERIQAYVRQNLSRDMTTDELAAQVYMSRSHFSRQFKACTGMTAHQFITQQRLMQAKQMAIRDDTPFHEICAACGFPDYPCFYRTFCRETGLSPREYRRQYQKEARP